jgi:hypothetical protein
VTSRRHHAARPLNDARIRGGVTHGLTDYRARLGSEGEVSALSIGTYWFAGSVYEITPHPRPAARGFAGAVETDQPRELREGAAVVTLLNYHLGSRSTRASQSITDQRLQPFPAAPCAFASERRLGACVAPWPRGPVAPGPLCTPRGHLRPTRIPRPPAHEAPHASWPRGHFPRPGATCARRVRRNHPRTKHPAPRWPRGHSARPGATYDRRIPRAPHDASSMLTP